MPTAVTQPPHSRWPFYWHLLDYGLRGLCLLGIDRLFVWLNIQCKKHSRKLHPREKALATRIFGQCIDLDRVWVDETAVIVCKSQNLAYVSFNMINSWGSMNDAHLIHELVHIWQYQRFGPAYIPRALWAQHTPEGYNYGGKNAVCRYPLPALTDFNYEQQADLVADYFRLLTGQQPRWCTQDDVTFQAMKTIVEKAFIPVSS